MKILFITGYNTKCKIKVLIIVLISLLIIAPKECQSAPQKLLRNNNNSEYESLHDHRSVINDTNKKQSINKITNIKLISWPMPAPGVCNADLEGSVPPAKFRLSYREKDKDTKIIENNVNELMQSGWDIITRSERGYGFEKQGEFIELNFDIYEELSCSCNDESEKSAALVHVKIDWKAGSLPIVAGSISREGKAEEIFPVIINGRVAIYEFSFTIPLPLPSGIEGDCSSKLLAVFSMSNPLK